MTLTPVQLVRRSPEMLANLSLSVSSAFAADGLVFVTGSNGIFRSEDRGATFPKVDLGQPANVGEVTDDGAGTFYATALFAFGADPREGIIRSTDSGETWKVLGDGTPIEEGVRGVVALPKGKVIAVLAHRGLLCSVDRGQTWTPRCRR